MYRVDEPLPANVCFIGGIIFIIIYVIAPIYTLYILINHPKNYEGGLYILGIIGGISDVCFIFFLIMGLIYDYYDNIKKVIIFLFEKIVPNNPIYSNQVVSTNSTENLIV